MRNPMPFCSAAPVLVVVGLIMTGQDVWANTSLPSELSPVSMFLQADMVVKAVMVGLAIASLVSWTVLIAKKVEIARASSVLLRSLDAMSTSANLRQATKSLKSGDRVSKALVEAAADETGRAEGKNAADGIKERISLRFSRIEAAGAREIARGVSILATIGATAPFVGLFGTVWGIMNSFIGISKSQTTSLAVVAPGIAEALLATAIGLVAAIPAVIFYNHLIRSVSTYRALLGDAVATVSVIAGRELDISPTLRLSAE